MSFWEKNCQVEGVRDAEATDRTLLSAFLENIPDLVYFKDRDSRFIAVSRSKAERHGLDPAGFIGLGDADFFTAEHAQWARVDEEHVMNTGEPILGKIERIPWANGRQSWTNTSKLPLRDEAGEIMGTFAIRRDITQELEMQQALEKAKSNLIDASRSAGMAEVATGVLHNVGNVLTSLNVSAAVIATSLQQSKAGSLARLSALLDEHRDDLGRFLTEDPKGSRVLEFIESLSRHALEERDRLLQELASLQANVDHIKEIVTMQQAYATMAGVIEPLDASMLMEDATRMNAGSLVRHEVMAARDYQVVPPVLAEKAKVLQILVNFIRNAKYACDDGGNSQKLVTLRVEPGRPGFVRLAVQDNGIGIPPENLGRIFEHGFTTRRHGHGFGLHSAFIAAREMKGAVFAESPGPGQGATFTLELPIAPDDAIPANAYSVIPRH